MDETKCHDFAWSMSWIEFKSPNAQGSIGFVTRKAKCCSSAKAMCASDRHTQSFSERDFQ